DSSKDPSSPMNESVAGTLETATTPAATDENASVIDDASSKGRDGKKRNTNPGHQGHKRKVSEIDGDLPVSKSKREKSMTVDDEPSGRPVSSKLRPSMTQTMMLLNGEKYADIFRKPVTKKDAPDYAQAVLRPIDLGTIQKAIKAGSISSWEELEKDLMRMLANCCVYNRPGTEAHETARQ
ncbi:9714_t:CDS:2, partial [Acaulospora colombiana]